jgi:hypothetical protein
MAMPFEKLSRGQSPPFFQNQLSEKEKVKPISNFKIKTDHSH